MRRLMLIMALSLAALPAVAGEDRIRIRDIAETYCNVRAAGKSHEVATRQADQKFREYLDQELGLPFLFGGAKKEMEEQAAGAIRRECPEYFQQTQVDVGDAWEKFGLQQP